MHFNKALFHTVGLRSLNIALSFFINLMIVRLLGASHSGHFFYAITILSFVTLVTGWCLDNGIVYYASSRPQSTGIIARFIFLLLVAQALISFFVLFFINTGLSMTAAILFIVSNLAISYFSALYYSRKWFIAANTIVCIINVCVLLLLLLNGSYSGGGDHLVDEVSIVFIGGYGSQAFLLIMGYFFFSKNDVNTEDTAGPLIKSIFRFSTIVFISNFLFFLVTRVDYYFVESYCTDIALSNYVQVSKMGQLLLLLPVIVGTVIFPYTSGGDMKEMAEKTKRACRLLVLLFFVAAILIAATGYWIFPWLFGDEFNQMYVPMLLLLPGILCLTLLSVISAFLDGIKKIWLSVWANIAALIVIVIADRLLIPVYGINAAALISSVGYFVCAAVSVHWFIKLSRSTIGELFILNRNDLRF